MKEQLLALCEHLEPLVRPYGYHVGATGSALYGMSGHVPEDLDIILYLHKNDEMQIQPADLLLKCSMLNIKTLDQYPEFRWENKRVVFTATWNDLKVDFLFL